ncbi:nuclear transport factor 2 family protein [Sorangium sp. So ce406]|uniref:nuclear transport factor 2 family protein n=1 Tax=Sorangium sp. So ce406 TaxID=3133311 RepID=UPI003F5B0FD4
MRRWHGLSVALHGGAHGAPAARGMEMHVVKNKQRSPWFSTGCSRAAALGALALLGLLPACGDDGDASGAGAASGTSVGTAGGGGAQDGSGGGAQDGSGGSGGSGGSAGQGGGAPASGPNPFAAPLVDSLTRALSDGDEATLAAHLGPNAFYVDARGRSDAADAPRALLDGGPWSLGSTVDSHHDVFRVQVRRNDEMSVLFGAVGDDGLASWLALAAPPPSDPASTSPVIRAYQQAWMEGDEEERAALLEQCWADGARYVDPTADVTGRPGLDGTIAAFQSALPGATLVPTSGAIEAHGLVHFLWRIEGADMPPLDGMDVGFVDDAGALTSIAGFFGPLSPP